MMTAESMLTKLPISRIIVALFFLPKLTSSHIYSFLIFFPNSHTIHEGCHILAICSDFRMFPLEGFFSIQNLQPSEAGREKSEVIFK